MINAKKVGELENQLEDFSSAVRQVVEAITDSPGKDCFYYALIGASVLRDLGWDVAACAGSAAWRVGAGDGDVISHAPEMQGVVHVPQGKQAAMYHSWIEVLAGDGPYILDLTTYQMQTKANILDALDGGTTSVQYCPNYVFAPATSSEDSAQDVGQSYSIGAYAYIRRPEIERYVFNESLRRDCESYVTPVKICLESLRRGEQLVVRAAPRSRPQ